MSKSKAIIVGSGFGGSVTACRLAEAGMDVLVLERGRRWDPKDYPRDLGDDWIFDVDEPEKQNGWMDLRIFPDMTVAQGAGVGGGSLIYANVFIEAPEQVFSQGWPDEITFEELRPYYKKAGDMLAVQEIPDNQLTERFKLMRDAANALGYGDRFHKLPLAVTFDPDWHYDLDDRFNNEHSKKWTNPHGKEQGTCIHLGNCDIGCDVQAKNTLDLNYLARAEQLGAEVRPLHLVRFIEPDGNGYRVHFDRIINRSLQRESETADYVIIAAGSLNTTEILLRCKHQYKTLPKLSHFLGRNWSSNGDFLTPAFYDNRRISPTQGPTISAAIDFLDGSVDREQYFIEDGGFPDLLENALESKLSRKKSLKYQAVIEAFRRVIRDRDLANDLMPWFAQGIDAADGTLKLASKWYRPWRKELTLDWDIKRSEGVINAIVEMHKRLAGATGGDTWVPPTWTVLKNLITPHPLGGCNIGTTQANGVVDHTGKVFGYERLYVADGAVIPEALGRNPSRTIAALAERTATIMISGD